MSHRYGIEIQVFESSVTNLLAQFLGEWRTVSYTKMRDPHYFFYEYCRTGNPVFTLEKMKEDLEKMKKERDWRSVVRNVLNTSTTYAHFQNQLKILTIRDEIRADEETLAYWCGELQKVEGSRVSRIVFHIGTE